MANFGRRGLLIISRQGTHKHGELYPRRKRFFLSGWMNRIVTERRRKFGLQLLQPESRLV